MKTTYAALLLLLFFTPLFAQEVIQLKNPSFENPNLENLEKPYCCVGAKGWYYYCRNKDKGLNSPDAQPGNFGVVLPAIDGENYMCLVARDNSSWEKISQKLDHSLIADEEYWFSIALAKSDLLISQSRKTQKNVKYDRPIVLRIWGGDECEPKEMLAKSEAVENTEWVYFEFMLKPTAKYRHISLEAFYKTPTAFPYNGNLLLDDCSPIIHSSKSELIEKTRKERGQ